MLSSVFVPCCFLGGITGQFFRQFAVTIAVSTIISAINALTMTPSRAVLIFKTEEGSHGHELKREALPWWIFGVVGGTAGLYWYGPVYLAGRFGLPALAAADGEIEVSGWMSWAITAAYFAPGAVVGGVIGWLIIRPGERRAGLAVQGFQPSLRPDDRGLRPAGRRRAAHQRDRAHALRGSAGADLLAIQPRADGIHSAAGQGISAPQRAVARFGLGGANAAGHGSNRNAGSQHAGGRAHGRRLGPVAAS